MVAVKFELFDGSLTEFEGIEADIPFDLDSVLGGGVDVLADITSFRFGQLIKESERPTISATNPNMGITFLVTKAGITSKSLARNNAGNLLIRRKHIGSTGTLHCGHKVLFQNRFGFKRSVCFREEHLRRMAIELFTFRNNKPSRRYFPSPGTGRHPILLFGFKSLLTPFLLSDKFPSDLRIELKIN
ncbi:MAG: hypothetical protein IPK98_18465 [Chloracidobacterium sp.]|nr:hypothetical protein [Chloracidobacterium sp.]